MNLNQPHSSISFIKRNLKQLSMTVSLTSPKFTVTKRNLAYCKPRVQTSAGKKFLTYTGIEFWGKIEDKEKELF